MVGNIVPSGSFNLAEKAFRIRFAESVSDFMNAFPDVKSVSGW